MLLGESPRGSVWPFPSRAAARRVRRGRRQQRIGGGDMGQVGFGQPDNGVIQMAYVVADLDAAIREWSSKLRVGPWFVREHLSCGESVYRGQPSRADVRLAMSFAGHMNMELIQPNNDAPSVYREVIERRG